MLGISGDEVSEDNMRSDKLVPTSSSRDNQFLYYLRSAEWRKLSSLLEKRRR